MPINSEYCLPHRNAVKIQRESSTASSVYALFGLSSTPSDGVSCAMRQCRQQFNGSLLLSRFYSTPNWVLNSQLHSYWLTESIHWNWDRRQTKRRLFESRWNWWLCWKWTARRICSIHNWAKRVTTNWQRCQWLKARLWIERIKIESQRDDGKCD